MAKMPQSSVTIFWLRFFRFQKYSFTLRNRDLGDPKPDFFAASGGWKHRVTLYLGVLNTYFFVPQRVLPLKKQQNLPIFSHLRRAWAKICDFENGTPQFFRGRQNRSENSRNYPRKSYIWCPKTRFFWAGEAGSNSFQSHLSLSLPSI